MKKPVIGITMGDAAGVGPEILLKVLQEGEIFEWCYPLVIGDYNLLAQCNEHLNLGVDLVRITGIPQEFEQLPYVYDLANIDLNAFQPGKVSGNCGLAAVEYLKEAILLALSGEIQAIVTCPLNKEAVRLFDSEFRGHTEMLAEQTGTKEVTMALISPKLTVTHVTTHVSMAEACQLIKKDRVLNVIKLTYEMMERITSNPKIAVAGFNPHAGENGAFGCQEIEEIGPAVEMVRAEGKNVVGPLPPDTVFLRAVKGEFDAVVAMYHDQGHIPMKLLDFEGAVNVTLGLPIIRTSVDHGTAFDIAWQGRASHRNLKEAIKYACLLCKK